MTLPFSLVVAMDAKGGIGKNGGLPWHLSPDLKQFKKITTTTTSPNQINAVIMGRKTWESLPERFRPLPGRINCVLTKNEGLYLPGNVLKATSLEQALSDLPQKYKNLGQVFVIGGAQIFNQAINDAQCQKIYTTHILREFDCDTFFSTLKNWQKILESPRFFEKDLPYYFAEYIRQ